MTPLMPRSPRSAIAKASAGFAAYEGIVNLVDRARVELRERFTYTVTITEDDPLYLQVHLWLLEIMPEETHRALMVGSRRQNNHPTEPAPGNTQAHTPLQVTFNATKTRPMELDGENVHVLVNRPENAHRMSDSGYMSLEPESIEFRCWTKAGQRAVLRHLEELHTLRQKARKPRLMMLNQWSNWTPREDLPPRPLSSVILPEHQKTRITEDLTRFLAAEHRYNELAVPWHRGYLFHGPPGGGKTSLVKALAHEFNLDLWYVSLSDIKEEHGLMGLLANVEPGAMLLLEDIDTIRISHDRDTQQGAVSMASLLNALDGVTTPHGLITVMTTNHFDRLDPALTRAGRMDVIEELGPPTVTEVAALYQRFYNEPLPVVPNLNGTTMAAVAETFKRHLDNPAAAAAALTELVPSP